MSSNAAMKFSILVICMSFVALIAYQVGVSDTHKNVANTCQHYKAYSTSKFMLICEVKL